MLFAIASSFVVTLTRAKPDSNNPQSRKLGDGGVTGPPLETVASLESLFPNGLDGVGMGVKELIERGRAGLRRL